MPDRNNLNGLGVLVTRPAHQAGPLCDRIAAAGGRPVRFPLLAIRDLSDTPAVAARLAQLADYQLAIFISPNAVELGLRAINRHGGLPPGLKLACVGRGSARTLAQRLGREPDIVPETRYDSEGLLALPALQAVAGQRILILRGEGGRELLADTLRRRGAQVDYLELYRRECPPAAAAERDWLEKTDIITITSSESLQNLLQLTAAKERSRLLEKPLLVVSERTAALARELGFRQPALLTPRAGDEALLQMLADWAHRQSTEQQQ
jgi:uroporphyrinogen-III synthase